MARPLRGRSGSAFVSPDSKRTLHLLRHSSVLESSINFDNGMSPPAFDIIGDVHGHAGVLRGLLETMGYRETGGVFRHRERIAVFVGDYVDRGPEIREVLWMVKRMTDAGAAVALMGNHDYNLLRYLTADGRDGGHLREHNERHDAQVRETLVQLVRPFPDEWEELADWLVSLPVFLKFPGLHVVHACWDPRAISELGGDPVVDSSVLLSRAGELEAKRVAVEVLLKGPEIVLPEALAYEDVDGNRRRGLRIRWYLDPSGMRYRDAAFPLKVRARLPEETISSDDRERFCPWPEDRAPVIFGHYGFPGHALPLRPNVACVDLGVARGGPLTAYRWDGEKVLDPAKFVRFGGGGRPDWR